MFRAQAQNPTESANRYRQPMPVVGAFRWSLLFAIALAAIGTVIWSVVARIPETLESVGILVHQQGISQVNAVVSGELLAIHVRRGDEVTAGQLLAEIKMPGLEAELVLAREKLKGLQEIDARLVRLTTEQLDAEEQNQLTKQQTADLTAQSIQAFAVQAREITDRGIEAQTRTAKLLIAQWQERLNELQTQRDSAEKLLKNQLATRADLATLEGQVLTAKQAIAQLNQQIETLELQKLEQDRAELQTQERLKQFDVTKKDLDRSLSRLKAERESQVGRSRVEIEAQEQLVQQLEQRIEQFRFVRAMEAGRVLEVPIAVGQPIVTGTLITTISRSPADADEPLQLTAFFPLSNGKRLAPGQEAFITPMTVERERHGSIRGVITDQYEYPMSAEEALRLVGNRELIAPLAGKGGILGVHASLNYDADSKQYAWTSTAPEQSLSVGTTATIRVVVERRAPITYLLPSLRKLFYGPTKLDRKGAGL